MDEQNWANPTDEWTAWTAKGKWQREKRKPTFFARMEMEVGI